MVCQDAATCRTQPKVPEKNAGKVEASRPRKSTHRVRERNAEKIRNSRSKTGVEIEKEQRPRFAPDYLKGETRRRRWLVTNDNETRTTFKSVQAGQRLLDAFNRVYVRRRESWISFLSSRRYFRELCRSNVNVTRETAAHRRAMFALPVHRHWCTPHLFSKRAIKSRLALNETLTTVQHIRGNSQPIFCTYAKQSVESRNEQM